MYEFFEHTADVGIRIRAPGLEQLFAEAGEALMAFILENPLLEATGERVSFTLSAGDLEDLLHDWLGELLYVFETRHIVLGDFRVTLAGMTLTAESSAEPLDPQRHRPSHEVKAVTYHGLTVEPCDGGYLAEVVLDI